MNHLVHWIPLRKQPIHEWYLEVMQHIELSTIFITHDIDEAILLSDRIYILNGKPGEIRDEIIIKEKKPRAEDFTSQMNSLHISGK